MSCTSKTNAFMAIFVKEIVEIKKHLHLLYDN